MLKEHAICTHVELGTSCLLTGSAKLANKPCVMDVPYREQTISILLCTREVVVSLKNASTQKCARNETMQPLYQYYKVNWQWQKVSKMSETNLSPLTISATKSGELGCGSPLGW